MIRYRRLRLSVINDYEFTYEDGKFVAREEGLDDLVEPEDYTVIYS